MFSPCIVSRHTSFSRLFRFSLTLAVSQLPFIHINYAVFESWMQDDLTLAEQLLTEDISHPFHHACALAQRALVRVRLKQWCMASDDAKKVILSHLLSRPVLTVTRQVYQSPTIRRWPYRKCNDARREPGPRICDACIRPCVQ